MSINLIPQAVLENHILPCLNPEDLIRMQRVSKQYRESIRNNPDLWRIAFKDLLNHNFVVLHLWLNKKFKTWSFKKLSIYFNFANKKIIKITGRINQERLLVCSTMGCAKLLAMANLPKPNQIFLSVYRKNYLKCISEISNHVFDLCKAEAATRQHQQILSPYCNNYNESILYCQQMGSETGNFARKATTLGVGLTISLVLARFFGNNRCVRLTHIVGGAAIAACGTLAYQADCEDSVGKSLLVSGACLMLNGIGIDRIRSACKISKKITSKLVYATQAIAQKALFCFKKIVNRS